MLGSTRVQRWSYSTAKALDEHLALAHAAAGLPVAIVRYFNAYGPRLDPQGYGSVVARFLGQALAGEPLTVHGDGTQSRCFTYVADTVAGTVLAARTRARRKARSSTSAPSARRRSTSWPRLIIELTGSTSEIERVSYERAFGATFEDAPRRRPDITRARTILGWEPRVELRDGLARTLDWWVATHG